jgi:hypothetical protein
VGKIPSVYQSVVPVGSPTIQKLQRCFSVSIFEEGCRFGLKCLLLSSFRVWATNQKSRNTSEVEERGDVGHRVVRDIRLSANLNQLSVKRCMDQPPQSDFMDI